MPASPCWSFGPFRLDPMGACLWRGDQLIALRPKPFAVLACLVAHAEHVVSKETLLDAVWPNTVVSEGVLKTCMGQIRQALGETARAPRYIATVHRRGYRLMAPVTAVEIPPGRSEAPSLPYPPMGASAQRPQPVSPPSRMVVARESELTHLHQCFAQALLGERQVVFITGEAGIGKSSLVETFVAQLPAAVDVWIGHGQCIEQYGAGEAYLPLLEALGQLGRRPDAVRLVTLLGQQAPNWLLQLPALVPAAEFEALRRRTRGTTQGRMLRELAEAVEALTAAPPLVLVLEDLHWSDLSTLEWLAYVAQRRTAAQLLRAGDVSAGRGHRARPSGARCRPGPAGAGPGGRGALGIFVRGGGDRVCGPTFRGRNAPGRAAAAPAPADKRATACSWSWWWTSWCARAICGRAWEDGRSGGWRRQCAGVPESLRQLMERQLAQLLPRIRTS